MITLGDDYPKQQARVRTMLKVYQDLGPVGLFGATMIEDLLQRADKAAVEQDTVAMIRIYQEMKDVR